MLTLERAKELLQYDAITGILTWRKSVNSRSIPGAVAGSQSNRGYHRIKIDGERYQAHRVAWLLYHGAWPTAQIDHVDNNRSNNAIANLRDCSGSQNQHNQPVRRANRSGIKGVSWCTTKEKWHVQARTSGAIHQGGYFSSLEDAGRAATELRNRLHGEFARHV